MSLIFIGRCRGIKIVKDTSLKKDEYYLACSQDVVMGILNHSSSHAILHNAEKAIGFTDKKGKERRRGSHEKKQKA